MNATLKASVNKLTAPTVIPIPASAPRAIFHSFKFQSDVKGSPTRSLSKAVYTCHACDFSFLFAARILAACSRSQAEEAGKRTAVSWARSFRTGRRTQ